jgi:hypothetical protein
LLREVSARELLRNDMSGIVWQGDHVALQGNLPATELEHAPVPNVQRNHRLLQNRQLRQYIIVKTAKIIASGNRIRRDVRLLAMKAVETTGAHISDNNPAISCTQHVSDANDNNLCCRPRRGKRTHNAATEGLVANEGTPPHHLP